MIDFVNQGGVCCKQDRTGAEIAREHVTNRRVIGSFSFQFWPLSSSERVSSRNGSLGGISLVRKITLLSE